MTTTLLLEVNGHILKETDLVPSASDVYDEGLPDPHCLPAYAVDGKFISGVEWYEDFCAETNTQSWFQVDMGQVHRRYSECRGAILLL